MESGVDAVLDEIFRVHGMGFTDVDTLELVLVVDDEALERFGGEVALDLVWVFGARILYPLEPVNLEFDFALHERTRISWFVFGLSAKVAFQGALSEPWFSIHEIFLE